MNVEELKLKIRDILGENINFNNEFKKHASKLKNQEINLIGWCFDVADKKITPKPSKRHKEIIIFIKKKKGIFTECHLGDHKYYDYLRKQLGL